MKLSPTQRALILSALEEEDADWFFRASVRPRNLTGLVKAGAVALIEDRYQVTAAAVAEIRGF